MRYSFSFAILWPLARFLPCALHADATVTAGGGGLQDSDRSELKDSSESLSSKRLSFTKRADPTRRKVLLTTHEHLKVNELQTLEDRLNVCRFTASDSTFIDESVDTCRHAGGDRRDSSMQREEGSDCRTDC